MEVQLKDILASFRRVTRSGSSNTITLPKEWASIGEMVIVVVKGDNTIILKKNIEIKNMDVK